MWKTAICKDAVAVFSSVKVVKLINLYPANVENMTSS
jgi:hypothetical protein